MFVKPQRDYRKHLKGLLRHYKNTTNYCKIAAFSRDPKIKASLHWHLVMVAIGLRVGCNDVTK